MHKRLAAAVFGGLLMVGATSCGTSKIESGSTSTTSTTSTKPTQSTTPIPSTTPTSTRTSVGTTTTTSGSSAVNLRVVVCATKYGVVPPPSTTSKLPGSIEVVVPNALASELAIYADSDGLMKLVGPTGWTCSAEYGADGSGGVAVYPPGEPISQSAFGAGWHRSSGSTTRAIVGSETSACQGCALG